MINPQDFKILTDAILATVPPEEHRTAMAAINVGLHLLNQLERIANALDRTAAAQERIAMLRG